MIGWLEPSQQVCARISAALSEAERTLMPMTGGAL